MKSSIPKSDSEPPSSSGLKKNWAQSELNLRTLIEPLHHNIPIIRQCELLGLPRSSYYYEPKGESPLNMALMHRIDEIYTRQPYLGYPKVTDKLRREGHTVNEKRIARLMRLLGLQGIRPRKHCCTSRANLEHKKYAYLLREITALRPNHVWGTDITYIPLENGFCYLVAIIDWYSRYVIAWELSNSLETSFCIEALNKALQVAIPEIHNSDQGCQYTSLDYTGILEARNIKISMDGRGRCFDNIFTERLWRTVKYEDVYIKGYQTMSEVYTGLSEYFPIYNTERPHQSLGYRTPAEVFFNQS